jgi:hypothetical protein
MNRMKVTTSIVLALMLMTAVGNAENKIGQTGLQFLSVGTDGRGGALGQAMTALENKSEAMFYNPAAMAKMNGMIDLTASQNNWIFDIKHNAFSLALRPGHGQFGVFGATFRNIDYGDVEGTMVWQNDAGYIDTEIFNPTAFSAGIGYAKELTNKFSVGGHISLVGQQLGNSVVPHGGDSLIVKKNTVMGQSVDFGTLYYTGFKSLAFGMSVRNFSNELKYEDEGFQLPLTFTMGLSMDLLDLLANKPAGMKLKAAVDAVHYRSHPEQINIGMEYTLFDMIHFRGGYRTANDLDDLTFGFGISKFGLVIDYASTPFGDIGNVERFTVKFSL